MKDPTNTIDRLVAKAGQLYSLPAVAMKVLELTQNPTVDTHALKECIERDPALTTRLLRVVNSSLFGLSREVRDLNQALALLGTKPLKLLVLGFSLPSGLFAGVGAGVLARYWRRTLTKAVAARELCETLWNQPGDEVFIAGLLQDLGMLLLIQELGEPYLRFLDKVLSGGSDLPGMERESMGFDHTQLTARLLAQWGLPRTLVETIDWRIDGHAQDSVPAVLPMPVQVLHLAELFAELLVDGRCEVLAELLLAGEQYQGLSQAQVEVLAETLEEKVGQLADVLSLQLPDGVDHRDLLVRAHAQLGEVAGDAAEALLRRQFQATSLEFEGGTLLEEFQSLSEAVARVAHRPAETPGSRQAPRPAARAAATAPISQAAAATPVHSRRSTARATPAQQKPDATADDPELLLQLASAVAMCRQSRSSLSLMLIELDRAEELVSRYGVQRLGSLRRFLEVLCRRLDQKWARCLPYGEVGFAVILPCCDRQAAVQHGNQLVDRIRQLGLGRTPAGRPAVSISAGVATVALPPKNFLPRDLFAAADRCLYGARASGGGVAKSIEIY